MSSWYFHKNLKPQGPLSLLEIQKKIMRGEIAPTDLVTKDEESWRAACEWPEFRREMFPAFQNNYFKTSTLSEKEWILLRFENEITRQEGPYSVQDIQGFLNAGKIQLDDYVWRAGLTGWVQVRDRQDFFISPDL